MNQAASKPTVAAEGAGLDVRNVTATYRSGNTALHDASFSIPRGTITALVGVNGSGKSTLFKSIMGFVPLARGSVSILGQPAAQALKRNLVAYVPQAEEVDWNFPILVEDVVMMGRYGHMNFLRMPARRDREMVDEALARVNMSDFRKRQIGELSGGQKKRVFLARALAQEGQVILLDEPFTGVDAPTQDLLNTLYRSLAAEGLTILMSTHDMIAARTWCTRIVGVRGHLAVDAPAQQHSIEELYAFLHGQHEGCERAL